MNGQQLKMVQILDHSSMEGARGNVIVSMPYADEAWLRLFNHLGEELLHIEVGQLDRGVHSIEMDSSGLPGGRYFLQFKTDYDATVKVVDLN